MNKVNIILLSAILASLSTGAHAVKDACVYLKPGAGYSVRMHIESGDFKSKTTGYFNIGQHRCQSLSSIAIGSTFTVYIKAAAGKTKKCPPLEHNSGDGSVTFFASGTTQSVHCSLPGTKPTDKK